MANEPQEQNDNGLDGASDESSSVPPKRPLNPAAKRALAEAEQRRAVIDAEITAMPEEKGGRKGPEPVRYGDWESKGIASDF